MKNNLVEIYTREGRRLINLDNVDFARPLGKSQTAIWFIDSKEIVEVDISFNDFMITIQGNIPENTNPASLENDLNIVWSYLYRNTRGSGTLNDLQVNQINAMFKDIVAKYEKNQ
jgi:hypothetical protein